MALYKNNNLLLLLLN